MQYAKYIVYLCGKIFVEMYITRLQFNDFHITTIFHSRTLYQSIYG